MTPRHETTWPAERVIALRHRLGMTQVDFAAALDTSVGSVSRWERDVFHPTKRMERDLDRLEKKASR